MGELMTRTNRTNRPFVRIVRTTHTTPFRGVCFVRELARDGSDTESKANRPATFSPRPVLL
jgi:hypothetical protein